MLYSFERTKILERFSIVVAREILARSRGVAQPGRAPGSGPGGRRFKSSLPDHFKSTTSEIAGFEDFHKRTYIGCAGMGCAKNSRHTVAAAILTASTLSSHHVRL